MLRRVILPWLLATSTSALPAMGPEADLVRASAQGNDQAQHLAAEIAHEASKALGDKEHPGSEHVLEKITAQAATMLKMLKQPSTVAAQAREHSSTVEDQASTAWDPNAFTAATQGADRMLLGEAVPFLRVGSAESDVKSFVTPAKLEGMTSFPGIDYLGMGYDLLHGNPEGEGRLMLDPGFRDPIRKMDYTAGWLSRDSKYLCPKGAYLMPLQACQRSSDYTNIATADSYSQSLSLDASLEASAKGFGCKGAFKASAGYKRTKNEDKQTSSERYTTKSYCHKYFASWLHKTPTKEELAPQFAADAVEALKVVYESRWVKGAGADDKYGVAYAATGCCNPNPSTGWWKTITEDRMFKSMETHCKKNKFLAAGEMAANGETRQCGCGDKGPTTCTLQTELPDMSKASLKTLLGSDEAKAREKWFALFRTYGTHYVTELTSGGKTIHTKFVKKEAVKKAAGMDASADVSVAGSGFGFQAKAALSVALNKQATGESSSETSGEQIVVIGGLPVDDAMSEAGFAAWASTVADKPMPIRYKMAPFSGLAAAVDELAYPTSRATANIAKRVSIFESAYNTFMNDYTLSGEQEPFLDESALELDLAGGVCIDDTDTGDETDWPKTEPRRLVFPEFTGLNCHGDSGALKNWRRCRNEELEQYCYDKCFSAPFAKAWKLAGNTPPADLNGMPVGTQIFSERLTNKLKAGGSLTLTDSQIDQWGLLKVGFNDYVRVTKTSSHTKGVKAQGILDAGDTSVDTSNDYYVPDISRSPKPSVAMGFIPSNGAAPTCICYDACPKVVYDSASLDQDTSAFGRRLKISCHPESSTVHLCSPDVYTPWPKDNGTPVDMAEAQAAIAASDKVTVQVYPESAAYEASWGKRSQGGAPPGAFAWFMAGNSVPSEQGRSNIDLERKKWVNLNRDGPDATLKGDNLAIVNERVEGSSHTIAALTGTTADEVDFGEIFPNGKDGVFTLCSLTRYRSTDVNKQKLILTSAYGTGDTEFKHGHQHDKPLGFNYYGKAKTATSELTLTGAKIRWVATCGTNNQDWSKGGGKYMVNGKDTLGAGASYKGGEAPTKLLINPASRTGRSDFAVAEVIAWDRALSDEEMQQAHMYLLEKIGPNPQRKLEVRSTFDLTAHHKYDMEYARCEQAGATGYGENVYICGVVHAEWVYMSMWSIGDYSTLPMGVSSDPTRWGQPTWMGADRGKRAGALACPSGDTQTTNCLKPENILATWEKGQESDKTVGHRGSASAWKSYVDTYTGRAKDFSYRWTTDLWGHELPAAQKKYKCWPTQVSSCGGWGCTRPGQYCQTGRNGRDRYCCRTNKQWNGGSSGGNRYGGDANSCNREQDCQAS
jgi:hypothetical protein